MKKFEKLLKTKNEFQNYIRNPKLVYTYIAPKNKYAYEKFRAIVDSLPTVIDSQYVILNDIKKVEQILFDHFSKNTELEIYVATNDIHTNIRLNGTLKEYIKNEKIEFNL